eukprot:TRINITY_DN11143_c0_g2_i1.p2 TRINITY_DN11143_c0_g2~~TRINITY_DN11143_c0_g2_i1.p2  ORF type:complete len:425 (+),score=39.04 TRINITY_DN11143_c0_g2_i1:2880-4154(+)
MAANILANRYEIDEGEVWIVPNLNYKSIVENSRGVHGDMNRKFKDVDESDPDYDAVERIKSIILDEKVDVILHLHDGSGFYRKEYIDASLNPQRWGQSSIIDTKKVDSAKHGELEEIAQKVADSVNEHLLEDEHKFHVKNTNTPLGKTFEQKEMLKTLTYFTIKNNKAAFANEASKNLHLETRVYYHLRAIESYMDYLGISYTKDFELTPSSIKESFYKDIEIEINDKKIVFPTANIRDYLGYIPLKKDDNNITSQTPLIISKKVGNFYDIYYGAIRLTRLSPQYFEYCDIDKIEAVVDGKSRVYESGDIVEIDEYINIKTKDEYRVNVIGFIKDPNNLKASEDSVDIYKKEFIKRFSIDTKEELYRAEMYRDGKYCGMLVLKYKEQLLKVWHKVTSSFQNRVSGVLTIDIQAFCVELSTLCRS